MKTRTVTTRPLPGTEASTIGPLFEVTITGVGTKTLPLPYAWGILFDTHIKGLHAVAHDSNGELFVELTRDRKILGDTSEAEEFKNWALFMFKQFEQYVAVITSAPAAPASTPSPAPVQSQAVEPASREADPSHLETEAVDNAPQGDSANRQHAPRRGRR